MVQARVGLAIRETPRDMAFCAHALPAPDGVLVVEDTHLDTRFADNPLVTGEPKIRFYAGAPLVTSGKHVLGTLCVIDRVPRTLDDEQLETLKFMATQVIAMLEAKAGSQQPQAVDKNRAAGIERLRKVIAQERAAGRTGSDTLQLLTERMRAYENGSKQAPNLSEFIEWRNLVELERAKSRFGRGLNRPG
ncbi:GAF domain-containing protein [Polaromonas sp.]|uniref:GAF domain-containing protein n=1 Tax=Polaromonas sp. TaxID=1869339 RepID=UPI0025E26384|nr:GAF domain-containing protein [Polaromonas sp.]